MVKLQDGVPLAPYRIPCRSQAQERRSLYVHSLTVGLHQFLELLIDIVSPGERELFNRQSTLQEAESRRASVS